MSNDIKRLEEELKKNTEELKHFLKTTVLKNEFLDSFGLTDIDYETIDSLFKQLNLFLDSQVPLNERLKEILSIIDAEASPIDDSKNKINKVIVSREAYDYTFFEDLEDFELTHSFAFECTKRKNPFLLINDELYKMEKIDYLVESQNVMCIKDYINEEHTCPVSPRYGCLNLQV